jgi:threonine dehydrogenase-like Zn-dependent dehydrogenase
MGYCGECRNCLSGNTNQCLRKHADYGFDRNGGYGPYMIAREGSFFPVSDAPPDMADMTVLLDVMGTGGHALKRANLIHPKAVSLLVTGAGPIGLGVLAMAKILRGDDFPVLISDVIPYRLELARQLGGMTINVAEEPLGRGMARHGFAEVDAAVDASGREAPRREALDHLAKRGVLVCVGHGEGLSLAVSPDLIAAERAVLGSEYFCYHELHENLPLFQAYREYITQIITHRFPVARLDEAFSVFQSRQTGKVVIQHQDQPDGR